MLKQILFITFLFFFGIGKSQTLYFPPITGNAWDTASLESYGWCRDKVNPLYNYLEARNTKAFIVLKDGKIVMEKYFDKFTKDSLWYWASAAKTLTAFTIGIAQQEGYLSINDVSSKYLGKGWMNGPQNKEDLITIKHQLTMTTGLDDGVKDNHCTIDTCLIYKADAGARWAYHNGPYTLLDKVIETSTGVALNTYINTRIGTQTGLKGLFVKSGNDNLFISTPRSMARFGLLMLSNGDWDINRIMKDKTYLNQMVNTSQNLNNSYGYLCWLNGKSNYMVPSLQLVFPGFLQPNAPSDMYSAIGKNGQFMNVIPSQNLVVIRMGNAPDGKEVPFTMNDTMMMKLKLVMCKTNVIKSVANNYIKLYPNPVANLLTIESEVNALLTVFTINGKELFHTQILANKSSISTEAMVTGMYIFSFKTSQGTKYYRVVKA